LGLRAYNDYFVRAYNEGMIKSLAALVVLASGAHAQVRIAPIQTVGSMAIGGALTGPMTSGNLTAVSVQPLASTVSGVIPSAPALTPSAPVAAPSHKANYYGRPLSV
jgi:hypothetical protein